MQLLLLGAGAYNPIIAPAVDLSKRMQILNSISIVLLFFAIPASWIGYKLAFGTWLTYSPYKKFLIGFFAQFLILHSMNVLIIQLAKNQIGPLQRHSIHGCDFG